MSGPVSAWTCKHCGHRYPVPSLARQCEHRHEREWAVMDTEMSNYDFQEGQHMSNLATTACPAPFRMKSRKISSERKFGLTQVTNTQ